MRWEGFPGAPGYNVFYALPGGGAGAFLNNFYATFKNLLPAGVKITVPSAGNTYNQATGEVTGVWSSAANTPQIGTDATGYSAPSGLCFNWITDTFVSGKRLKGRTFIVPAGGIVYDTDGSIKSTYMTVFQGAADTLISATSGHLGIWHRPHSGAGDGVFGVITSAVVRDRAAILTSRRQ